MHEASTTGSSRAGMRTRVKRWVARQLLRGGGWIEEWTKDQVPCRGFVIETASPRISKETKAALRLRMYESSERRAVERFLPGDLPVVELGAGIGYITGIVARRKRPPLQLAVEADPEIVQVLERNVRVNRFATVHVVNGAISYGDEMEAPFLLSKDSLTGCLAELGKERGAIRQIAVPAVTLGALLERFGITVFDLLCDIEGAELELVEHEQLAVVRRCRRLIIELHPTVRRGVHFSRAEIHRRLCERWGMGLLSTDGKVWVYEARP